MQKFSDTVSTTGASGALEVLSTANVVVYLAGTTTPAALFSDNGVTSKVNPFQSTSTGRIEFYAADGRYDLVISKAGYATVTVSDVLLEDPDNIDDDLDGVTISNSTIVDSTITGSTLDAVGSLSFSATPDALTARRMAWNPDEETLDVALTDTGVVLQVGQETHYHVINNTGTAIPNGTLVKVVGTVGGSGKLLVAPAAADGVTEPKTIIGLTTATISNGAAGFVTHFGKIRGVQTNGADVGETWVDGDILYASTTTPGKLTNVRPVVDGVDEVTVAIVVNAHGSNGILFVRPTYDSHDADVVRYTPSGTGAVATNVQSKLRENVTPTDFGSGASSITAALAYLSSIGGGTLEFTQDYDVANNSFTVPSNVFLKGNGHTLTKSSNSTNARIFIVRNVVNVRISGFVLDGNYTGASTGSNPVIEIGDISAGTSGMLTENIWVTDNFIKNGNHALVGVYGETDTGVAGCKNIYVTNNTLQRAGAGVFCYKGTDGLHVSGNTMRSIGAVGVVLDTRAATDSNTTGVYPIINSSITNNIMVGIGGDVGFQGTGVTLKGALENIIVKGNTIRSVTSDTIRNTYGILLAQSFGSGSGAAATAVLTGTAVTSFTIGAGGSGYTRPPNVFISSGTGTGAAGTAVLVGGALDSITLDTGGEHYAAAPFVQIIAGDIPRNVIISDNIIDGVGDTGGTLGWPIYVQSGSRDVTISNNQIRNCKRGIVLDAPDTVAITGNILRDIPTGGTSLFPLQVAGVSATAKATNIIIDNNTIMRGAGNAATTHAIQLNFVDRVWLGENNAIGFDTAKYSISTVNASLVSGAIGSAAYDPPNLADGAGITATITNLGGAEVGDIVDVAFSQPLQGITMTGYVSAASTVQVRFQNETGGAIDLASGTLVAKTRKP